MLCIKAMFVILLWNFIVSEIFGLKELTLMQAIVGTICFGIITLKVKIKNE